MLGATRWVVTGTRLLFRSVITHPRPSPYRPNADSSVWITGRHPKPGEIEWGNMNNFFTLRVSKSPRLVVSSSLS